MNSVGIVTARDALCIQFTENQAWDTVRDFAKRQAEDARVVYDLGVDSQDWQVALAQKDLNDRDSNKKLLQPILYRPFDVRHSYYTGQASRFMVRPRPEVMLHMLAGDNIALSLVRSTEIMGGYEHVFVSNLLTTHHTVSIKEVNYHFPLRLQDGRATKPNFPLTLIAALQSALNLTPTDYRPEDPTAPLHAEKIFHYLYAVLHSPASRQRYAAFLRTDFPRIPIPGRRKLFDALAKLGAQLVAWHLLEHPDAIKIVSNYEYLTRATAFFGSDFSLQRVAEKFEALAEVSGTDDKVGKAFINATSGFADVHQSIWQHTIGGYQVLHKWLDDRRKAGRSLSQDDITHWLRVNAALEATQKLMLQVDEAIEANGGWPGEGKDNAQCAFSQSHPPPDAATVALEQMAQNEQLKAQKKAVTAIKKEASNAYPKRAKGLFDPDDDLDELAAASGAPPRPKAKGHPCQGSGWRLIKMTTRHHFVDEAGDTTLFGRHGKVLVGTDQTLRFFIVGRLEVDDVPALEADLDALRTQLMADPLLQAVPSMKAGQNRLVLSRQRRRARGAACRVQALAAVRPAPVGRCEGKTSPAG